MTLRSVWRRLTGRKRRRTSFYESQSVMRRAVEAQNARVKTHEQGSVAPDDKAKTSEETKRRP
jgi:hypothetical protein